MIQRMNSIIHDAESFMEVIPHDAGSFMEEIPEISHAPPPKIPEISNAPPPNPPDGPLVNGGGDIIADDEFQDWLKVIGDRRMKFAASQAKGSRNINVRLDNKLIITGYAASPMETYPIFLRLIIIELDLRIDVMDYFGNGVFFIGCSAKDYPIETMSNDDSRTEWTLHFGIASKTGPSPQHHSSVSLNDDCLKFIKTRFSGLLFPVQFESLLFTGLLIICSLI